MTRPKSTFVGMFSHPVLVHATICYIAASAVTMKNTTTTTTTSIYIYIYIIRILRHAVSVYPWLS